MISIKDHGIGMDSATQQAIFTRFYRADSSRSTTAGYGLGLAIAKKIVDAHQGVITVDSSLGNGSTFTIKLISAN
jgi:signal transduction histidine kinase